MSIISTLVSDLQDTVVGRATQSALDALRPSPVRLDDITWNDPVPAGGKVVPAGTPGNDGGTVFTVPPRSPIERMELPAPGTPATPGTTGTATTGTAAGQNGGKATETKTSDNVANPDQSARTGGTLYSEADLDMLPNILSEFHSPIANWRLFITSDASLKQEVRPDAANYYAAIKNADQITIAETGATGYNIKEVMITSKINLTPESRAATAVSFSVRLTEPYGTRFLDTFIASCAQLEVPNWRLAPVHLELTFRGHDPATGLPAYIPFRRIWAVMINDITAAFDAGVTTYHILLKPYNHIALSHDHASLKKQETVSAATLGDALTKLCEHLNRAPEQEIGDFYKTKNTYKFEFHAESLKDLMPAPDPATWRLVPPETDKTRPEMAGGFKVENKDGTTTVHLSANTRFEQTLEMLLAVTHEGQQMIGIEKAKQGATPVAQRPASGTAPTSNASSNQSAPISDPPRNNFYVYRIEPQVVLGAYNDAAGDYDKTITYHINFFEFNRLMIDRKQVDFVKTPEGQKKRWLDIKKRINKKYKYLYTGENTEVLDLKLEMNVLWTANLPTNSGYYGYSLMKDGRYLDTDKRKAVDAARAMKDYLQLTEQRKKLDDTPVAVDTHGMDPDDRKEARQQAKQKRDEEKAALDGKIEEKKQKVDDYGMSRQEIEDKLKDARKQAAPRQQGVPAIRYAEDATGDIAAASMQYYSNMNALTAMMNPTFKEEPTRKADIETQLQIEAEWNRSRSLFGALLNQVFGASKDFIEIDLSIRGDPWWLGADTYQIQYMQANRGQTTRNEVYATLDGDKVPNYLEHAHMFLLTFGFPVGYGEDGIVRVQEGGSFEGVYEVIEVTSTFDSEGRFTQTLKAKRDPLSVPPASSTTADQTPPAAATKPAMQPAQVARAAGDA